MSFVDKTVLYEEPPIGDREQKDTETSTQHILRHWINKVFSFKGTFIADLVIRASMLLIW